MRFVTPVALALVLLTQASTGLAARAGMPDKYRFTAWLTAEASTGQLPGHLLMEGDGGALMFTDRWNLTQKAVTYRVCVVKNGASSGPCRDGTAPVRSTPSGLPMFVRCCGRFVAKWYVSGRLVATWAFSYIPEHD